MRATPEVESGLASEVFRRLQVEVNLAEQRQSPKLSQAGWRYVPSAARVGPTQSTKGVG